jgi:hypothetical protein
VILWGNGRHNVLEVRFSRLCNDRDADAFARDLMRCWAMCVDVLRVMQWWAQLWGLMGVMVVVFGGWWGVVFDDIGEESRGEVGYKLIIGRSYVVG